METYPTVLRQYDCIISIRGWALASRYRIAALDDADQHHRDRQDQQDVNEPAERVRAYHPQQPEHDEHDENRRQHVLSSSGFSLNTFTAAGPCAWLSRLSGEP